MGRGNGQVQITTRSGTNKYSGAAVWSIANSALDANTWGNNNDVVNGVFAVDLSRRGRSRVIVVGAGESPARVLTALFGTPPAEPSRPAVAEPDP